MSEKNKNPEKTFLTSATTKRLLNDVKNIYKNPLDSQGIYYKHDENDILKGYAIVFGPEGSLYDSGAYLFDITYPDNYPHAPPVFKFCIEFSFALSNGCAGFIGSCTYVL